MIARSTVPCLPHRSAAHRADHRAARAGSAAVRSSACRPRGADAPEFPWALRPLKAPAAWGLALALLLLCFGAAGVAHGRSPAEKEALQNKKNQIRQLQFEKEQVQRRLKKFRGNEDAALVEIGRLVKESKALKKRERELARQWRRQRRIKKKQQKRITELTATIKAGREQVAGHMRRLYRLSKTQDSATLVSLVRFKDFFRDSRYLGIIIRADREAIEKFQRLNKELEKKKKAAEETLARLTELRKLLAQEKRELKKTQRGLNGSLAEMRKNRGLYAKYLGELEKTRQGMEAALVALETKNRRKPPPAPPRDPEQLRGKLPAPAPGRVIAGFGEQDPRYALKKFQRGLVIRVADAAPVNAVAPGRAVHAGPFRGYQQLVVLDHGQGLFTVYGHLEKLRVKRGGWVPAGTVLGEATYQPIGSAYDIYFEIRMKGTPLDPMKWLEPGGLQPKEG